MAESQVTAAKSPALVVDEELVKLGAPAQGARLAAMASIAIACIAAVATLLLLRADLSYYFAGHAMRDLGAAATLAPENLQSNAYVHVRGTPMLSRAVRAEQRFGTDQVVVFPLAGQRAVFVQVPASQFDDVQQGSRRDWAGRLVRFGDLAGRFSSVRAALRDDLATPVTSESYLLIADDAPGSDPTVLFVALLCTVILAANVFFAWLAFRPLPVSD